MSRRTGKELGGRGGRIEGGSGLSEGEKERKMKRRTSKKKKRDRKMRSGKEISWIK